MATGGALEPGAEPLESRAAAWLAAEDLLVTQPKNDGLAAEAARLAHEYEEALAAASTEELRLAWEAARRAQAEQLIGTTEWVSARRVSELLRTEYSAERL